MEEKEYGTIVKISGPLVVAKNMQHANMFDVVKIGDLGLIGEIIEMKNGNASIQVYEETAGLKPGEKVISTLKPLSVELGPGLLGNIFDGIQRPLQEIEKLVGNRIKRGMNVSPINREKKWCFKKVVNNNDEVIFGDIVGIIDEGKIIKHKIMVPNGIVGKIIEINEGNFKVDDIILKIKKTNGEIFKMTLLQHWPVRKERPYFKKIIPSKPLVTGQRIIDTLFPIALGGTAAIPGPFGSGKTVVQHQLAKWAEVDIVVYIGCGERGNEMTDVLLEFPELIDPKTKFSLMERTILIANTSDMPVAAREASIYTGITIAEYYRDMGYNVAIMADSTSRWAEALREMSGRLEEMPGEEGYPAYLASRLAGFYERAGIIESLGLKKRIGSITAIGAVSPPGGDLSEPVTQSTLKVSKVFWGLDSKLAYRRHFPAINWSLSYSLYREKIDKWKSENINEDYQSLRKKVSEILTLETKLNEIVMLVGIDAISIEDRLLLEIARSIREDFLHQNAFHAQDTYTTLKKQYLLIKLILNFHKLALKAVENKIEISSILSLQVREEIARAKYIEEEKFEDEFKIINIKLSTQIDLLINRGD